MSIARFFRFGGGVLGTQLLAYGAKNVDNVAIGAVWGAAPLGLYSRAYQLLMTPLNQINAPLTQVALPVLSRVQDDDVAFHRYLAKAQLVGSYVTATALTVCAGLAGPLVEVLFGPRWAGVAPLFALLAVGGVFRAVSQICYWIYLARGRPGAQFRLYLVLRPIMIVIILAGLPWGPAGVAAAVSVAFAVDWLASVWHVGRTTGVDRRMLLANSLRAIVLFSVPCGVRRPPGQPAGRPGHRPAGAGPGRRAAGRGAAVRAGSAGAPGPADDAGAGPPGRAARGQGLRRGA